MSKLSLIEEARLVYSAMDKYGGSFIRSLAKSMNYADLNNLKKIRDTWKDEWAKYLDFAQKDIKNKHSVTRYNAATVFITQDEYDALLAETEPYATGTNSQSATYTPEDLALAEVSDKMEIWIHDVLEEVYGVDELTFIVA